MEEPNPFFQKSIIDDSCLMKAGMMTVGGGAMGFLLAMFMNAVEMRDLDYGRTRQSTRYVFARDFAKMKGSAKSFAIFGGLYSIFECQVEKLREVDDGFNSFIGCGFTSMLLTAEIAKFRGLMMSGIGGGMFGWLMYKVQVNFMGH